MPACPRCLRAQPNALEKRYGGLRGSVLGGAHELRFVCRLPGQLALITGSSAGIGYALAKGLGQAGAQIVLDGRDPGRPCMGRLMSSDFGRDGLDLTLPSLRTLPKEF